MDNNKKHLQRLDILGIAVDMVNMEEALFLFDSMMDGASCSMIATPNPEIILKAQKDPKLSEIINSAALAIPDGAGLVKASRILGAPLKGRVTGIDFTYAALKRLGERKGSAFLLGSKPGVAEKASASLTEQLFPLKIAGFRDGYFKDFEESSVVSEINASGADLLCVALGSPKQEEFIARHKNELTVKVAIGIGGSLDVWSGDVKRAPDFYLKHNAEWLYRLLQDPSRIKRIWKLPLFLAKVYMYRTKVNLLHREEKG